MAFSRNEITQQEISQHGVVSCPDRMTGTATQNKQKFDELTREIVAEKFNGLLDDLEASSSAGNLGYTPTETVDKTNVQDAIDYVAEELSGGIAEAEENALKSEGYAVGKQDGVDVPSTSPYYHDNAKYYKEQTALDKTACDDDKTSCDASVVTCNADALSCSSSKTDCDADKVSCDASVITCNTAKGVCETAQPICSSAQTSCSSDKLVAEGYAVGTQNGVYVTEESPYYHNNSKYYSENAHGQFIIRYGVTTWASIVDAYQHGRNLVFMKYDSQAFVDTPIYYQLCKVTESSLGEETIYNFYFLTEYGGGYKLSKNSLDTNPPTCTVIHSGIKADDLDDDVQSSLMHADASYVFPDGGIPSSDMSSSVRASLNKADSSVQSVKTVNGQTMVGSGNITVAEASLSGTENPTSSVVASYIGQHYINTATKIEWVSVSINPTVWEIVNKSLVTNRNLLDNPWFTVNQRGQNSYNTNNSYTVDRWKLNNNGENGSISVGSSGVTFNAGTSLSVLQQNFESVLFAEGTTFTVSAIIDGIVYSATVSTNSYTKSALTSDVAINTSIGSRYLQIEMQANKSHTIKAVKLELGSISTLANDTAPNYTEELIKCQRYYYKIKRYTDYQHITLAFSNATNAISAEFSFPTTMRTSPSVNVTNASNLVFFDGSDHSIDSAYYIQKVSDINTYIVFGASNVSKGDIGRLQFTTGNTSYIEFSADL